MRWYTAWNRQYHNAAHRLRYPCRTPQSRKVSMPPTSGPGQPNPPELYRFMKQATLRLRWATLGGLLLITLIEPTTGRTGLPNWAVLLLFACYELLADLFANNLLDRQSVGSRILL